MNCFFKVIRNVSFSFVVAVIFCSASWAITPVNEVEASRSLQDCADHTVIVIDGGFDTENKALHEAFITKKYVSSSVKKSSELRKLNMHNEDTYKNYLKIMDEISHGTHTSGIIAAKNLGLAKNCKIIPIDVLDRTIDEALEIALSLVKKQNISAINISLRLSSAEQEAISEKTSSLVKEICKHTVIFKSPGNGGTYMGDDARTKSLADLSSACKGRMVLVGNIYCNAFCEKSLHESSERAGIAKNFISAPGTRIDSYVALDEIERHSGTSMSSPMALGLYINLLEKLIQDHKNEVTMDDALNVLFVSANKKDGSGGYLKSKDVGAGVIDLNNAVKCADEILGFGPNLDDWVIIEDNKSFNDHSVKDKGFISNMINSMDYFRLWS